MRRPSHLKADVHAKRPDIREIVMEKLDVVGMPNGGHKFAGEISSGMRKRAGPARALVLDQKILLVDEPASGLDSVRTAYLSQLLIDINAQIDDRAATLEDLNNLPALVGGDPTGPIVDELIDGPIADSCEQRIDWNSLGCNLIAASELPGCVGVAAGAGLSGGCEDVGGGGNPPGTEVGTEMGIVVHLSDRVGPERRRGTRRSRRAQDSGNSVLPDALETCADLIASTIAGRILELGGTNLDVRQLATSAAYAVFVSSAGSLQ
jgi:hypothetical protein